MREVWVNEGGPTTISSGEYILYVRSLREGSQPVVYRMIA